MAIDCIWWEVEPHIANTQLPPAFEGDFTGIGFNNPYEMQKTCIDRHNKKVNVVFMDYSVRDVKLKERWTLKWNQSFETSNVYTEGVKPWPDWMKNF